VSVPGYESEGAFSLRPLRRAADFLEGILLETAWYFMQRGKPKMVVSEEKS
jgi:hypothetical protein